MQLPVMPPVAPMLAKSVPQIPTGELSLRAEVGRLPLDRVPGRRRGRDRLPQREADDPLLPGDRRGGQGEPAGAVRGRRRDRGRAVGDRLEFEVLQQRIHPAASRVKHAVGADARHASSPSTCWRWTTTTTPNARSRSAAPRSSRLSGRRAGADPPHPGHPRPRGRPGLVRAVRGRRAGRRRGQAARRHLPAGQAGHVQDQARSAPPTASSRATACTRAARTASGRCCSACTTTTACWPRSA